MRAHRILFSVVALCLAVAAPAQAGIRADLSGDSVVDFQTTMDMPFMTIGNPGNIADPIYGYGGVAYAYNMGKYEVTSGQYTEFLNAVAVTDTYGLYNTNMGGDYGCKIGRSGASGSYSYSVAGDYADRPVNYVSWGDAARFANWMHNGQPNGPQGDGTTEDGAYYLNGAVTDAALQAVSREGGWQFAIPTEDEWYKAAYHKNDGVTGNYFYYPTSSMIAPGYVNNDGDLSRAGIPFTEGGTDPGNYATTSPDGWPTGISDPYYRTEVGEWENSDSPYGTFDQGGNVYEWHEGIVHETYRGLRGGSAYHSNVRLLGADRWSYNPTFEGSAAIGLRIVEVPEPATLFVMGCGAIGLLRRRRREFACFALTV